MQHAIESVDYFNVKIYENLIKKELGNTEY